jgi:phosphoenolpyruvate synthase/pyruvate phosphate dikinase
MKLLKLQTILLLALLLTLNAFVSSESSEELESQENINDYHEAEQSQLRNANVNGKAKRILLFSEEYIKNKEKKELEKELEKTYNMLKDRMASIYKKFYLKIAMNQHAKKKQNY